MKFIGIIPARYASTRFPAKPLALLGGKPVIQRVYEQVCGVLDDVYVATDDERIETAVKAFGGKVVMTSPHHKSGTDRCREAYHKIGGNFDVVVNIQGDEPFIHPSQLEALKACFEDKETQIATLVKPFTLADGWEALENVNSPKVVVGKNGNAFRQLHETPERGRLVPAQVQRQFQYSLHRQAQIKNLHQQGERGPHRNVPNP